MFEPLEWLYVMRLATRLLPELSFHRDEEAAGVAASLGGVSIDTLRDFDWSSRSEERRVGKECAD